MNTAEMPSHPKPDNFFETVHAFQRSAAMKAAIELDVFTAIADGATDATSIAQRCKAAERGIRILCDYLVILGFLKKNASEYTLTEESQFFLNRRSPAYIGSAVEFLISPRALEIFHTLTTSVRNGGLPLEHSPSLDPENEMWVTFARAMMPLMYPAARAMAEHLPLPAGRDARVLDIAASHGLWGISVAQRHPNAHIVALDWKNVVEVARENAAKAGLDGRHTTLPGDAFEIDFGGDYDAILLPNFIHHFDIPTNEKLLVKCARNLRPGGHVAIVDFVPNDDRVSPPTAAGFAMTMLAGTPAGDVYTFTEYEGMLKRSGFARVEARALAGMPQTLILGRKTA